MLSGDFSSSYLAGKFSKDDGSTLWKLAFLKPNPFGRPSRVAFDGFGAIVIAGTLAQPFDFGGGTLDPGEYTDIFLLRYAL